MLGFYTAEFNDGGIIHAVINDENSPYYYDWRGILSDPDNRLFSIYDHDGKFYYYDFTAYKYSDCNHNRKRSATLSTGEKHDSANACLIDLIENYPFVRM